ncbi:MAG: hypothetical protein AAF235_03710 [Planctomycetota bacterium]
MNEHDTNPAPADDRDAHLALFITGYNASSIEPEQGETADDDGHVVVASVLRQPGGQTPLAPVRIRVAHGVAPSTAAAMLRKAAYIIESDPGLVSEQPGMTSRRLPDGTIRRRHITAEGLLAAADDLDPITRSRLFSIIDQIKPTISEDEDFPQKP